VEGRDTGADQGQFRPGTGVAMEHSTRFVYHLKSAANRRGSWYAHEKLRKQERMLGAVSVPPWAKEPVQVVVNLHRAGRRPLDAHDNLPMAFKAVVDGIAARLKRSDCDPFFTWSYSQEVASTPAITITFTWEE